MEVVAGYGLVGFDDHVVALTDADEEFFGGQGLDGDEVGGYHCEVVTVETDFEVIVGGCVDESKAVFLALDEGVALVGSARAACRVDVCAVDEDVVGSGRATDQTSREFPDQ